VPDTRRLSGTFPVVDREDAIGQLTALMTRAGRVAVDGIDAAGKTTLADELAVRMGPRAVRASIDGFHRPRAERVRYFEDSFDLVAFRRELIDPLGPTGSRRYRPSVFDYRLDAPVEERHQIAPSDAVLIVDGIFLQRPELDDCWDLRIFVDVSFEEALRRALARDGEATRHRYETRYFPAQRRYLAECRPRERAHVVFVNEDPADPSLEP
jgi:uridine kinase